MTGVRIEIVDDKLLAYSDYHPSLPEPAKQLGGRWNPDNKCWWFNPRYESRVRELYKKTYGTDGSIDGGDLVTVRVTVIKTLVTDKSPIYLFGRRLASAMGRDSGADLADGVAVLEGAGFTSGGSMKNWGTKITEGCVFEIVDVPRDAVKNSGCVGFGLYDESDFFSWEILDDDSSAETIESLTEKRAALLLELESIENKIKSL